VLNLEKALLRRSEEYLEAKAEPKQAGMQAQRVDIDLWPTDSTDPHENLKQMREKLR